MDGTSELAQLADLLRLTSRTVRRVSTIIEAPRERAVLVGLSLEIEIIAKRLDAARGRLSSLARTLQA